VADIQIRRVTLYQVQVPLKKSFITHLQLVKERESILVEVEDVDGTIGVGECVAFSSPWYTEETVETAWLALEKWIIPIVLKQTFNHPDDMDACLSHIKRNHMAKSCMNQAIWDIYAKKMNLPLWQVIGGTNQSIEAGIVVASSRERDMMEDIESAISNGYKRVKVKISRNSDPILLKKIIGEYPETLFFADANGDFTDSDIEQLRLFDDSGFTLIEQPFSEYDNKVSAKAQKLMKTPFALDESISSIQDVEDLIERQSGKIVVMKQGRVGGLSNALRIHDLCLKANVPLWVGGMIEFGVSKAFNLAFASLPGVKFPGDFSTSTHFWHEDLAIPDVEVRGGKIKLSMEPGIGYTWNHESIKKNKIKYKQFKS